MGSAAGIVPRFTMQGPRDEGPQLDSKVHGIHKFPTLDHLVMSVIAGAPS